MLNHVQDWLQHSRQQGLQREMSFASAYIPGMNRIRYGGNFFPLLFYPRLQGGLRNVFVTLSQIKGFRRESAGLRALSWTYHS